MSGGIEGTGQGAEIFRGEGVIKKKETELVTVRGKQKYKGVWEKTSVFGARQQLRIQVTEEGDFKTQVIAQGAFARFVNWIAKEGFGKPGFWGERGYGKTVVKEESFKGTEEDSKDLAQKLEQDESIKKEIEASKEKKKVNILTLSDLQKIKLTHIVQTAKNVAQADQLLNAHIENLKNMIEEIKKGKKDRKEGVQGLLLPETQSTQEASISPSTLPTAPTASNLGRGTATTITFTPTDTPIPTPASTTTSAQSKADFVESLIDQSLNAMKQLRDLSTSDVNAIQAKVTTVAQMIQGQNAAIIQTIPSEEQQPFVNENAKAQELQTTATRQVLFEKFRQFFTDLPLNEKEKILKNKEIILNQGLKEFDNLLALSQTSPEQKKILQTLKSSFERNVNKLPSKEAIQGPTQEAQVIEGHELSPIGQATLEEKFATIAEIVSAAVIIAQQIPQEARKLPTAEALEPEQKVEPEKMIQDVFRFFKESETFTEKPTEHVVETRYQAQEQEKQTKHVSFAETPTVHTIETEYQARRAQEEARKAKKEEDLRLQAAKPPKLKQEIEPEEIFQDVINFFKEPKHVSFAETPTVHTIETESQARRAQAEEEIKTLVKSIAKDFEAYLAVQDKAAREEQAKAFAEAQAQIENQIKQAAREAQQKSEAAAQAERKAQRAAYPEAKELGKAKGAVLGKTIDIKKQIPDYKKHSELLSQMHDKLIGFPKLQKELLTAQRSFDGALEELKFTVNKNISPIQSREELQERAALIEERMQKVTELLASNQSRLQEVESTLVQERALQAAIEAKESAETKEYIEGKKVEISTHLSEFKKFGETFEEAKAHLNEFTKLQDELQSAQATLQKQVDKLEKKLSKQEEVLPQKEKLERRVQKMEELVRRSAEIIVHNQQRIKEMEQIAAREKDLESEIDAMDAIIVSDQRLLDTRAFIEDNWNDFADQWIRKQQNVTSMKEVEERQAQLAAKKAEILQEYQQVGLALIKKQNITLKDVPKSLAQERETRWNTLKIQGKGVLDDPSKMVAWIEDIHRARNIDDAISDTIIKHRKKPSIIAWLDTAFEKVQQDFQKIASKDELSLDLSKLTLDELKNHVSQKKVPESKEKHLESLQASVAALEKFLEVFNSAIKTYIPPAGRAPQAGDLPALVETYEKAVTNLHVVPIQNNLSLSEALTEAKKFAESARLAEQTKTEVKAKLEPIMAGLNATLQSARDQLQQISNEAPLGDAYLSKNMIDEGLNALKTQESQIKNQQDVTDYTQAIAKFAETLKTAVDHSKKAREMRQKAFQEIDALQEKVKLLSTSLETIQKAYPQATFSTIKNKLNQAEMRLKSLKTDYNVGLIFPDLKPIQELNIEELEHFVNDVHKKVGQEQKGLYFGINATVDTQKSFEDVKKTVEAKLSEFENNKQFAHAYSLRQQMKREISDLESEARYSSDANSLTSFERMIQGGIQNLQKALQEAEKKQAIANFLEQLRLVPDNSPEALRIKSHFIEQVQDKVKKYQTQMAENTKAFNSPIKGGKESIHVDPALISTFADIVQKNDETLAPFLAETRAITTGTYGFRKETEVPLTSLNGKQLVVYQQEAEAAMQKGNEAVRPFLDAHKQCVEGEDKFYEALEETQQLLDRLGDETNPQSIQAKDVEQVLKETRTPRREAINRGFKELKDLTAFADILGAETGKMVAAQEKVAEEGDQTLLQQLQIHKKAEAEGKPILDAASFNKLYTMYTQPIKEKVQDCVKEIEKYQNKLETPQMKSYLPKEAIQNLKDLIKIEKEKIGELSKSFAIDPSSHTPEPIKDLSGDELEIWEKRVAAKTASALQEIEDTFHLEAFEKVRTTYDAALTDMKKRIQDLRNYIPPQIAAAYFLTKTLEEIEKRREDAAENVRTGRGIEYQCALLEQSEDDIQQAWSKVENLSLLDQLKKIPQKQPSGEPTGDYITLQNMILAQFNKDLTDYKTHQIGYQDEITNLKTPKLATEWKQKILQLIDEKIKEADQLITENESLKGKSAKEVEAFRKKYNVQITKGHVDNENQTHLWKVKSAQKEYSDQRAKIVELRDSFRTQGMKDLEADFDVVLDEQDKHYEAASTNIKGLAGMQQFCKEIGKAIGKFEALLKEHPEPYPKHDNAYAMQYLETKYKDRARQLKPYQEMQAIELDSAKKLFSEASSEIDNARNYLQTIEKDKAAPILTELAIMKEELKKLKDQFTPPRGTLGFLSKPITLNLNELTYSQIQAYKTRLREIHDVGKASFRVKKQ